MNLLQKESLMNVGDLDLALDVVLIVAGTIVLGFAHLPATVGGRVFDIDGPTNSFSFTAYRDTFLIPLPMPDLIPGLHPVLACTDHFLPCSNLYPVSPFKISQFIDLIDLNSNLGWAG